MRVIATSGHVDHGKSSLTKALTGTNPDRFEEERRRGLTIDLGFAHTTLDDGTDVAIVDVPGHTKFLSNMLAGVGAVDAVVFVVSAGDGWQPQSEEHLRILEMFGHNTGVIALAKRSTVDEELAELARMDVEDRVAGSFLENAPIIEVDSLDGLGLDELRAAISATLAKVPPAADNNRPRLWVDRAFTITGSGTVVTGTLTGGTLQAGSEIEITPGEKRGRIRSIQMLGRETQTAPPGSRTAINLSGVDLDQIGRGSTITLPGQWHKTRSFDVGLTVLEAVDHAVSRRGAHVIYLGSGRFACQLRILGSQPLAPGESGFARIHTSTVVPLAPGDRFVLRESGRDETIGGGEVLDVDPVLPAAKATPDKDPMRMVRERGWIDADELERKSTQRIEPVVGNWVVDGGVLNSAVDELKRAVEQSGNLGLDIALLDDRQRECIPLLDGIRVDGGRIRPADAAELFAGHPYLAAIDESPLTPPPPSDDLVAPEELREMLRRGLILESDGLYFSATSLEQARSAIGSALEANPDGITVAAARDTLGVTRKYALPLLLLMDSAGMTRRRGDVRIAGPRLRGPAADS